MMSSVMMPADSTTRDKRRRRREEKRAKRPKKERKKKEQSDMLEEASEHESDLDLEKEVRPIGGYCHDREEMVEQMFRSISAKKLRAMLPNILKAIPLDELKKLCVEQVEIMSRKRITGILNGVDPEQISSSGTEESSAEDENVLIEEEFIDESDLGSDVEYLEEEAIPQNSNKETEAGGQDESETEELAENAENREDESEEEVQEQEQDDRLPVESNRTQEKGFQLLDEWDETNEKKQLKQVHRQQRRLEKQTRSQSDIEEGEISTDSSEEEEIRTPKQSPCSQSHSPEPEDPQETDSRDSLAVGDSQNRDFFAHESFKEDSNQDSEFNDGLQEVSSEKKSKGKAEDKESHNIDVNDRSVEESSPGKSHESKKTRRLSGTEVITGAMENLDHCTKGTEENEQGTEHSARCSVADEMSGVEDTMNVSVTEQNEQLEGERSEEQYPDDKAAACEKNDGHKDSTRAVVSSNELDQPLASSVKIGKQDMAGDSTENREVALSTCAKTEDEGVKEIDFNQKDAGSTHQRDATVPSFDVENFMRREIQRDTPREGEMTEVTQQSNLEHAEIGSVDVEKHLRSQMTLKDDTHGMRSILGVRGTAKIPASKSAELTKCIERYLKEQDDETKEVDANEEITESDMNREFLNQEEVVKDHNIKVTRENQTENVEETEVDEREEYSEDDTEGSSHGKGIESKVDKTIDSAGDYICTSSHEVYARNSDDINNREDGIMVEEQKDVIEATESKEQYSDCDDIESPSSYYSDEEKKQMEVLDEAPGSVDKRYKISEGYDMDAESDGSEGSREIPSSTCNADKKSIFQNKDTTKNDSASCNNGDKRVVTLSAGREASEAPDKPLCEENVSSTQNDDKVEEDTSASSSDGEDSELDAEIDIGVCDEYADDFTETVSESKGKKKHNSSKKVDTQKKSKAKKGKSGDKNPPKKETFSAGEKKAAPKKKTKKKYKEKRSKNYKTDEIIDQSDKEANASEDSKEAKINKEEDIEKIDSDKTTELEYQEYQPISGRRIKLKKPSKEQKVLPQPPAKQVASVTRQKSEGKKQQKGLIKTGVRESRIITLKKKDPPKPAKMQKIETSSDSSTFEDTDSSPEVRDRIKSTVNTKRPQNPSKDTSSTIFKFGQKKLRMDMEYDEQMRDNLDIDPRQRNRGQIRHGNFDNHQYQRGGRLGSSGQGYVEYEGEGYFKQKFEQDKHYNEGDFRRREHEGPSHRQDYSSRSSGNRGHDKPHYKSSDAKYSHDRRSSRRSRSQSHSKERYKYKSDHRARDRSSSRSKHKSKSYHSRERSRSRHRSRSRYSRERSKSKHRHRSESYSSRDRSKSRHRSKSRDSKEKSSHRSRSNSHKRSSSLEKERSRHKSDSPSKEKSKSRERSRDRSRSRRKSKEKSKSRDRSRSDSRHKTRDGSRSHRRSRERSRSRRTRSRSRDRSRDRSYSRRRSRSRRRSKDRSRSRRRSRHRSRSRYRSRSSSSGRHRSRSYDRHRSRSYDRRRSRSYDRHRSRSYERRRRSRDRSHSYDRYRNRFSSPPRSRDNYNKGNHQDWVRGRGRGRSMRNRGFRGRGTFRGGRGFRGGGIWGLPPFSYQLNLHMMNLEVQRQAWEQYARDKGIPEHEWPMQFKFFSEGLANHLTPEKPPQAFVDNRDPVSDTSGSDYSDDSRSRSRSASSGDRGQRLNKQYQSGKVSLYDTINSSEQASSGDSDFEGGGGEPDPIKKSSKVLKTTDLQESNIERLKRELAKKKALLSSQYNEPERPAPKKTVAEMERRSSKRPAIESDEAVPLKRITRYEKDKKVMKIGKNRRKNEQGPSHSQEQQHKEQAYKPKPWVEREKGVGLAEDDGQVAGSEEEDVGMAQMEILELEMRARAIKAMLKAQEELEKADKVREKRRPQGSATKEEIPEKALAKQMLSEVRRSSGAGRRRQEEGK